MADWSIIKDKQPDSLKNYVKNDYPDELRPQVWLKLAGTAPASEETKLQYHQYLQQTSSYEKIIQRDIARTYPENDFFKEVDGIGQQRLANVIKAYSVLDEEVGYCQGSAFIVGLLLLQLDEVDAFVLFCKIMQEYKMREIYKPSMTELGLNIYQLECLVQELLPELHVHFQNQNYYTSMYSTSWFLSLFTSTFSLKLSYRIMDIFLAEGLDIIFKLSISILQLCKFDLLRLNMEGLLVYFQTEMPPRIEAASECFFEQAFKVKFDSKKMKKLCKTFTTINKKEQEELIELRRLRTENKLLQDRSKALEDELKELADKLIKGQVSRAQEAEDQFVLKRELSQLRDAGLKKKIHIEKLELKINELERLLSDRTVNYSNESQMLIQALQEELVAVKLREAENHVEIDTLKKKIADQDSYMKSIKESTHEDPIKQLQDELNNAKLRASQSINALKELQGKFDELQRNWKEHLRLFSLSNNNNSNNSQPNSLDQSNIFSDNTSNVFHELNNQSNNKNLSLIDTTPTTTYSLSYNSNNKQNSTINSSNQQPKSLTAALANSLPLNKLVNSVMRRNSSLTAAATNTTAAVENSGTIDASDNTNNQQDLIKIKEEFDLLKLSEDDALNEAQGLKSRQIELQNLCNIQESKYKKKEEETQKILDELLVERDKVLKIVDKLNDEQEKLKELEWTRQEDSMVKKLKDVERVKVVSELNQKISSLEIKIQAINNPSTIDTTKVINNGTKTNLELAETANELSKRMAELKEETSKLEDFSNMHKDISTTEEI